jgi:ATP-dependent 26S proteasome regulatory subunit
LVLDERVRRLVQQDFEMFLSRRSWYEENDFPYRRGYLFHGPPGNGKTSVLRVMASQPGLSIATINLGDNDADDDVLTNLFGWSVVHAPALIYLEDLDRHFCRGDADHRKNRISFSHFLNCLDGIVSNEGVIVVATANDPERLDPAILARPGRFDRVVDFPRPTHELRVEYLRRQLRQRCGGSELDQMATDSEGFSYAQLREAYIFAGQTAYERGDSVSPADLEEAIAQMSGASDSGACHVYQKRVVGFGSKRN